MSNPLKNAMGKIMKNALPSSPLDIIGSILSGGNPEETLMNMLAQKNPQGYQQVKELMDSGKNPDEVMNQLLGNMNPGDRQQIETIMKTLTGR